MECTVPAFWGINFQPPDLATLLYLSFASALPFRLTGVVSARRCLTSQQQLSRGGRVFTLIGLNISAKCLCTACLLPSRKEHRCGDLTSIRCYRINPVGFSDENLNKAELI